MKIKNLLLLSALSLSSVLSAKQTDNIYHDDWIDFNKNGKKDIYEDKTQSVEARVADLLSQMTVEEKSCQLVTLYGYNRVLRDPLPTANWKNEIWKDGIANIDEHLNGVRTPAEKLQNIYPFSDHVIAKNATQRWFIEQTRLGIPAEFSNEGIHGLTHSKATSLPAPIGIGSTWNPELVLEAGEIVGKEAKALGYHNVYAPILDVPRDPRWGRVVECYSEDPYLVATLGKQMVEGIQSNGVAATLKHFAAYSVPKGGRDGRCRTDAHISPRELHEIHLYPFKKVIQNTHPYGVMSSYNDWNGEPVSGSYFFLTELLRDTYGFTGVVTSDSQAVEYLYSKHQVAENSEEVARQVLSAGLNVRTNFTHPETFAMPVRNAIESGLLDMSIVDQRVSEVLSVKFRLGIFDHPYVDDAKQADEVVGSDKHVDFIKKMQQQAIVLLKNEGELLPLDKKQIKKLCVVGPLADEDNFMSSRYGPNNLNNITVLNGLKKYVGEDLEIVYSKGCEVVDENWPDSEIVPTPLNDQEKNMISQAVEAASSSDVIIAVLGEDDLRVGESRSRTSLDLPGRQQTLLEALYATGKPVVLVLINGQPLTINWADRFIPSILEAWFPGHMGGEVIAEMLFGETNPGGKLPITFPKSIGQIEYNFPYKKGSHGAQSSSGPNGSGKTRVIGSLYPFGYGLSYTTFEYSNLKIDASAQQSSGKVDISFDLKNTGSRDGDEVVQLYVHDKFSSVVTYESVLRGFERVSLKAGESKSISFTLTAEELEILDKNMEWTAEKGDFEVRIAASSEDIKLRDSFEWK